MAENTAPNAANTPTQGTGTSQTETAAQVFQDKPATYDAMNGQEAKAADIVAKSQVSSSQLEGYNSGLSGSENVAKQIVDSTRDPNAKIADYKGMEGLATEDLNAVTPAAGQPMGKSGAPMADLNDVNVAASGLATHVLDKPTAGHTETVHVSSGELLSTTFDPNSADLSMHGKDLVMSFNDGGKIVLEGFANDAQDLPSIALPNGAIVAGGVIVAQLQGTNEELFNLETAAGAQGGDGGYFIYSDDFGNVIDLLSKLPPIPFTALAFSQPNPNVTISAFDPAGGDFFPGFETLNGSVVVSGGFEDWQPNQHIGDYTVQPMALNIQFVPDDNEVVDLVTITNVPAGVKFIFEDAAGNITTWTSNGTNSFTMTGADMASGKLLVMPIGNSGTDIPMKITLDIRDPDSGLTATITKDAVAVVDSVADKPVMTTEASIDGPPVVGSGTVNGKEDHNINFAVKATFNDNDGSEVHTIVISGVPDKWTIDNSGGLTFVKTTNPDGTVTYTATVTSNVNTTVSFKPNEWTSDKNGGDAKITITSKAVEDVKDGEIRTDNNEAKTETKYTVHIDEDKPTIVTPVPGAPSKLVDEDGLLVPGAQLGVDQVKGEIKVDFKTDNVGATIKLDLGGLPNLTSHGETVKYALSADGKTITAYTGTDPNIAANQVFTLQLGAQSTGQTQTVEYTFTLLKPLDHATGNGENLLNIPFKFVATDSDGDKVTGNFGIDVKDSTPTAVDVSVSTDETSNAGVALNGTLPLTDKFGADGKAAVAPVNESGMTSNFSATGSLKGGALTSNGDAVTVTLQGGQYVGKTAGGTIIFTLDIKADGTYTFTQYKPLDHANGADPNDVINLNFDYIVKDFDGDTATGTLTVQVRDDAPIAANDVGNIPDGSSVATGDVIANDTLSKDQPNTLKDVSFGGTTKSFATPDGSDAGGKFVLINGAYGQLKIYENGKYTYTYNNAAHSGNHTEQFNYTLVDGDGDTSKANLTLNIVDNGPGVPPAVSTTVDETTDIGVAISNTVTVSGASQYSLGNPSGAATFTSGGSLKGGALTSNGQPVTVTLVGGKYVGTAGGKEIFTLTIDNTGKYTFTQKGPLDHADGANPNDIINLNFTYTAKDADGDAVSNTITINVKDDAPTAVNVSATTDETSNTGVALNGTLPLNFGVDGKASAGPVSEGALFGVSGSVKNNVLTSNGAIVSVGLENGQYVGKTANGTLIFTLDIKADGTYTFTQYKPLDHANGADPNDVINLTFGYVVKDYDGDTAEGTITINVRDDAPVAVADIGNIPNGSSVATGNVITNDTVSKDAPNLLKDASFGGTTKSFATPDGSDAGGKYVLINGAYGQLKIYENGQYTYTYNNAAHSGNHTEVFNYTLVDSDGDTSKTTLTVNIVDSGPGTPPAVSTTIDETTDIGVAISNTLTVPGATQYVLGNPAGNPTFNAGGSLKGGALTSDGHPITVTLVGGKYVGTANGKEIFTLTIDNTGKYIFTQKGPLDHANGADPNDIINLNFTYTAKDADGDAVSNTITVNVRDDAPVAVADVGTLNNTAVATGNVITNDTLSKDTPNLLKDVSFGGTTKSFATPDGSDAGGKFVLINGAYGQLKIYENGQYTYTYNTAAHSGTMTEQFKYTLIDDDGDTSQTTLTFNIVDNGPGTPPAVSKTIDETTDIGKSITDTITVPGATQYVLGNPAGNPTFTAGGSVKGGSLTSEGNPVTVTLVGNKYVGTANGKEVFTLEIDNTGKYTFVQKGPLDHADGANPNDVINLNFTYTAKDADGDAVSNTITINVKDDAPLAIADVNTLNNTTVATGNVVTNDTLSKDAPNTLKDVSFGGTTKSFATPDGSDAGGKFVLINGAYGQLKIYQNGQYTYTYNTAAHSGNLTEQFKYTLVDSDGDTSQTTLTLNIVDNGPGTPPSVSQTIDETTDIGKSVVDTITVPGASQYTMGSPTGAASFSAGGSLKGGALTSDGHPVTVTLVGGKYVGTANGKEIFTLTIDNTGKYTFVQKGPLDHADGNNPNDIINLNFNYTAKDADGDAVQGNITINVRDDAPVAVADVGNIPNGSVTANGDVTSNDTMSKDAPTLLKDASFGGTTKSFATPDGSDAGGKFVLINGTYGQLKIYENGKYTYTYDAAHHSGTMTEQFKYTLIDDDGDTSQTTLTLNIVDNGPGTPPVVEKTVDETTDLNVSVTDTITVSGASNYVLGAVNGAPAFSSNGSLKGGALYSNGVAVTVSLVGNKYVGTANGKEVFTLTLNSNGQYTFVQKGPLDHADGANPNDVINLNFTYTAKDADGDAVESNIVIHVKDDAPVAVADTGTVNETTGLATGNVVTNDTLSHDTPNTLKDVSFGGTTKSFATDGQTDAGGKYVIIDGAHGQLKVYDNGNYSYTLNGGSLPGSGGSSTDQFKYTLQDHDGDISQTTLTLNATLPKLIVGENVNDVPGSTTPYEVGPGSGPITGGGASDILVGDVGGSSSTTVQKDYNVALVLDISGSMGVNDRLNQLKLAVKNLLKDFNDYDGGKVTVHFVLFSNGVVAEGTYEVTNDAQMNAANTWLNGFGPQAETNYEAALQAANNWLNTQHLPKDQTFTYFVSDGEPNRAVNNLGQNTIQSTDGAVKEILGISDGTNEVQALKDHGDVISVGINVGGTALGILNQIDGDGHAQNVTDPTQLSNVLQGANPINNLGGVGGDTLNGGGGHDLIFGDSLNTDALAHAQGLGGLAGKGWGVFAELEANHGWTREMTINYIRTHVEELAHETHLANGTGRTGGNDTIDGGDGNDIIFGQEGNDTITGGAGNDILSGGSGNNTLTGGAGSDTFLFIKNSTGVEVNKAFDGHSTITDYNNAHNDKLDISDLLVGSTYTPGVSSVDNYVKIDHTTGQVFVDATGHGNFNADNHIATINNISSIDTVNVVLNDNEGTKTVHTV